MVRQPMLFLLLALFFLSGLAAAESLLDIRWMHQATSTAVQALLDRGADVDSEDMAGYTALMLAAWRGHVATV